MHTRCPHCLTLFVISDEQLEAADGKVHCSRCHQIFNARNSLHMDGDQPETVITPPEPVAESLSEPLSEPTSESLSLSDEVTDDQSPAAEPYTDLPLEMSDPTDHEVEESVTERSSKTIDLGQLLNNGRGVVGEIEPSESALKEDHRLPFEIPDDLPEIDPVSEEAVSVESAYAEQQTSHRNTLGWSLSISLLLLLALGQLGWFGREHLMRYPEGRQLLETACQHLGCPLPTQKAIDEIAIADRSISIHPDIDNALLVQVSFSNRASHPQPYPALQLSFYGGDEQLAAQRVFLPGEYLQRPADRKGAFPPGTAVQIQLELEDPGKENTGFKIDFL
ncbi:MAG: DUF3426 domain-containing protein [Sedimenticola sp.]